VHGLHAAVSGGARTSSTHSAQQSSRSMVCRCFACAGVAYMPCGLEYKTEDSEAATRVCAVQYQSM
jgi:hypothetical protein